MLSANVHQHKKNHFTNMNTKFGLIYLLNFITCLTKVLTHLFLDLFEHSKDFDQIQHQVVVADVVELHQSYLNVFSLLNSCLIFKATIETSSLNTHLLQY